MESLSADEPAIQAVRDAGYEIPRIQKPGGSYYRIKDETGSILRISTQINALLPGEQPGNYSVNYGTSLFVFTHKKFRHPEKFQPTPTDPRSMVINEDIGHELIAEEPSTHTVGDGTTISIKPAISQIMKTSAFAPNGEPVYIVGSSPLIKVLGALPELGV